MINTQTNRQTNRQACRAGNIPEESRRTPDFSRFNINDSYQIPITDTGKDSKGAEAENCRRLSKSQLLSLDAGLGSRDKEILLSIRNCRYLMSAQVARLIFTEAASPAAALRAANRSLKKLRELGLIDSLSRRIGGVRAGSGSLVWRLTHAGERLLRLHGETRSSSTARFEPSPYFLAHTLAVAETAVRLTEISRAGRLEITSLQYEPGCWREYSEYGSLVSLKPDLYAAAICGGYEDRYFLEIDLATESPNKIIEKCERYHKYYLNGAEQEETGMFPLTAWIVPTEKRKDTLLKCIRQAFDKKPKLFAVITMDELERLIRDGGDNSMLC